MRTKILFSTAAVLGAALTLTACGDTTPANTTTTDLNAMDTGMGTMTDNTMMVDNTMMGDNAMMGNDMMTDNTMMGNDMMSNNMMANNMMSNSM